MKVGVLVTGDTAVRAAHSLAADPSVDQVVVIGPARSKSFVVVEDASECDLLIGTGPRALERVADLDVPLVWDGETEADGVQVWGASPEGLTLSLAARETDPRLVAVAHPELEAGSDQQARFPDPVGRLQVRDSTYSGQRLASASSPNEFAAALAIGSDRRVTVVDDGAFLSGVALAAGVAVASGEPGPVWENALTYLQAATAMGLVMAED